jgi:hypothetical protein
MISVPTVLVYFEHDLNFVAFVFTHSIYLSALF